MQRKAAMQLLIYCCGGFGREVMDIARRLNQRHGRWEGISFLDDGPQEPRVYGAEVLPLDRALDRFGASGMEAAIANGEPFVRKALRDKLQQAGVRLASLIDDTAVVSETASIGAGVVIYPLCFVSGMANIGSNVAMIAGAMVGHDTIVGDNCVLSGHTNIAGACRIGSESYVGMGTQMKELISVGSSTIIGMGSVVYRDIPDEVIALGNPCRPMRPNTAKRVFASGKNDSDK